MRKPLSIFRLLAAVMVLFAVSMSSCTKEEITITKPQDHTGPMSHAHAHGCHGALITNPAGPTSGPRDTTSPIMVTPAPLIVPNQVFALHSVQIDADEKLLTELFPGITGVTHQMKFVGSGISGMYIKEIWDAITTGGYVPPNVPHIAHNFNWTMIGNASVNLVFYPNGNPLVETLSGDYLIAKTSTGIRMTHKSRNIVITLKI
jgi:hypothetical protein